LVANAASNYNAPEQTSNGEGVSEMRFSGTSETMPVVVTTKNG
jgi:hypothetical protein